MTTVAVGAAPQKSSNFYLGFLFLSKQRQEALGAVYGFARVVDDIVDGGEFSDEEAAKELDFWDQEVERLFEGKQEHPITIAIEPHVKRFNLPEEGFVELVKGVRMDLEKSRYETFEDLEQYTFGVAGAVGLLCVEIFGYKKTSAEDIRAYALAMGNAFQLTNILRDVGEDLERGRIYLPLADLKEAGCSEEMIISRRHTPEFKSLMNREYQRAKEFYREARSRLHPDDRVSMTSAEVMAHVYEALLDQIKEEDFRVQFQRVRVPTWRKLILAVKAWLYCRGVF
ncbi:MAG: squalene synthase HpnD [Elusimicrobia bacterium]|nr:MAG: squalene synthase HpnD [Elusimicrobiota bacterium]